LAQAYLLTRHTLKTVSTDRQKFEKICEILDALEADNQAANPGDDPLFKDGYLAAFRRLMTQVWDR
jgi:hypothetical protein